MKQTLRLLCKMQSKILQVPGVKYDYFAGIAAYHFVSGGYYIFIDIGRQGDRLFDLFLFTLKLRNSSALLKMHLRIGLECFIHKSKRSSKTLNVTKLILQFSTSSRWKGSFTYINNGQRYLLIITMLNVRLDYICKFCLIQ